MTVLTENEIKGIWIHPASMREIEIVTEIAGHVEVKNRRSGRRHWMTVVGLRQRYTLALSPAHPEVPPPDQELLAIVERMRTVNSQFYATLFTMNFGTDCHAFLEFCGLTSKYADLCHAAANAGIDFRQTNVHTGNPLPMENHDVVYLAEKFECIFGAFFRDNPDKAKLFASLALGLDEGDL
jgi:hypothetical protein